jgi:hypothetical protein
MLLVGEMQRLLDKENGQRMREKTKKFKDYIL